MNRKVGALDDDLIVRDDSGADISRSHENGLCELVADAYRAISGADVSVINAGSVRNNLMAGGNNIGGVKVANLAGDGTADALAHRAVL